MTVMPADAPRSDDGQWWWDGSQWQPVVQGAGAGAAAPVDAQAAQGSGTQPASTAVGQLSDDGQWQWDGTAWQPAQPAASGAGATGTAPTSDLKVTLGVPTAATHIATDGTPGLYVHYQLTNSGTIPIDAERLELGFYVLAEGNTAEAAAYVIGDSLTALAPGQDHSGSWPIQVDPGTWTVSVGAKDKTTGDTLATSESVTAHVAGKESVAPVFDESQTYALTVTITQFEHVQGVLFRIHYDLQCDRDVPAGLNVSGKLVGAQSRSAQLYDLTTGLTAGRAVPHYLTLEADVPDHVTASITVDPSGPSEKSDSVDVEIAADGTATMSR
jgi:hypothetical protein